MTERDIFFDALDRSTAERPAFLDAACAGSPELRAKVDALLRAHEHAAGFLETPAVVVDRVLALGPTVSLPPAAAEPTGGSTPPRVRLTGGPAAVGFDAETAQLLRRRLTVIAFVTAAALAVAMVPTLSLPLLGMRWVILVVELGCWAALRGPRVFSLRQLRLLELAVFLPLGAQLTAMPAALMVQSARAGDLTTVIMDGYFVHGVWVLTIVTYGLLIPNTWPRALAVMLPAGLIPYASPVVLGWYEPRVAAAFDSLSHGPPFPVVLLAVLEGMVYAQFLQGVRRDLHRARRFGQYRLVGRIGAGGMGEVYRAEHELLKRACAIKLIRPGIDADPAAVARFETEVRSTARLTHWNTVEIYDYGRTDDGTFYYVMELLSGQTLADLVRKHGPLPPGRVVYLLAQVCDALKEAHDLGLVHRDVKPGNVFAATRGGVFDVAKLLDFGLVQQAADGEERKTNGISGSPAYMAPEQGLLGGAADRRSDLYALGAVAYFLLTGRPPFDGNTVLEQIVAHARAPLVPPSARGAAVPSDLEAVVVRCLAKSPDDRFPDAASLRRALLDCRCADQWDATRAAAWWAARPDALSATWVPLSSAGGPGATVSVGASLSGGSAGRR